MANNFNMDDIQKKAQELVRTKQSSAANQTAVTASANRSTTSEKKWYAGEVPTGRETLAQIYKVSGNDTQKRTSLYNKYRAQTQDPTSVLYDPYTQATTARQNTTNINNTNKALREWDDLSRELSFWATSSRNYSDDEIIANIDWKKYPTLAKMDAGRESGKPLALLTSVGYSNDAMYGVIWGARNPDQKSDNLELDAVKSVLGRGNTYKRDENIAQRLNKASSTYAPYTVGATIDDLMVKYGTETFDDKWLADHAYMKLDPDMADDYATIYYAHQNTKELQKMAEEWKNDVLKDIERGVSLEAIFDEENFKEGYSKLYNLLESQRSGRLVNTTAAIDFDWEGMKKVAADAYLKKNGTLSTTEYEQQMNDLTGGTHKQSDVDAEIENGWLLNTDILGKQDMTPAESKAFKAKASAGYSDVVFTAADGVANGTGGYAEMQRGLINEANALAGKNLLNVMRGLAEGNRNTLADFVPEQDLKALQEYFPEQYAEGRLPTQEEFNAKRAESSEDPSKEDFWFDFEAQIYSLWNTEAIVSQERDQTAQYQEQLAEIEDAVAEAYGGKDTDQYRAFFASYEYAWDIVNQPDTFDEYDAFQRAAMAEGFDTSKAGDYLLSYAGNAGSDVLKAQAALENAKKMGMDAEAITALEKDLAKKQKNLALVNAHYLTANKDYSPQVKAFDEAYNDGTVTAAAGEHSAEVLAAVVNPEAAQDFAIANRYGKPGQAGMYTALLETAELSMVMTGEERSNYKYLYATKGEEAATAYFDALSENLIVRKSMQDSEARQEWAGENVGNAILATVGSVAVSPVAALEGVVNTLSALFGKDLNPHKDFKVAMAQSDLRTGVKDGVAEAADNEIVSGIFNAVYDAVTSAGDTLVASTTGGAWTMALSAMNSSMMDARMRGADTKTALAYGAANAVIELGTEKLGMDRIADAFKKKGAGGVRELLGEMLSGFANEFGEETVGNIAGQLTDDLIMGNMSNYNNAVEQYMSIGLSEEAAKAQAARDSLKEILYGGLVGGLSGGLTSGIGFVAGSVAGKNNPTKAPQKPAEAPVEQTPPVYQGTEKERAVSALSAAQGEGVGEVKQQATVQGVLQGLGVSAQESSAAAKMIMENAGMKMAQWLISKSDNPQDIAKALTFAQLVPQSRSAAVLGTKVNSENANAVGRELLEAYKVDSTDSKNVEQYETAVHESALADAAVEILEKEGSEAIAKANRDKKDREQEKREKTRDFRMKNAAAENAANALKEASAAVAQDASPENIKRQSEANKELQKAKSAREQARVAMEEANTKAKDAAEVEKKVVRNAQNSARMQAQQYVAQETEQRKAAEAEKAVKAERERAVADVKRQDDNIKALMADDFVQTYFAEAPSDTQQQLRERYIAYDDPTQQVTRENIEFATLMSKKFGFDVQFIDSHGIFEGAYTGGNTIVLDKNATQGEVIKHVLVHEITHAAESSKVYDKLADAVLEAYYGDNADQMQADIDELAAQYSQQAGQSGEDVARSELVAKRLGEMLSGNQEAMDRLVAEKPDVATRIWRAIRDFIKKLRGVNDPELDKIIRLEKMLEKALTNRDISMEGRLVFDTRKEAPQGTTQVQYEGSINGAPDKSIAQPGGKVTLSIPSDSGEPAAEIIRGGATKFSLTSWNEKEKETVRSNLVKNGYDSDSVDKWIEDVNSVAAIIAADKDRLDYKAADNQVMLKNNQEYVKTLDASTLCAKRLLYQGTFNAIQHELPNTVLTSEDLLHLSDMMNQAGLETPCGVCYVESRRRHLGKFAQEWLDSYEGEYKPTLDEVTTTDGLEALRHSHPKVYQDFVDSMNSKGSANPKVVQLRTDYRGDVRELTKSQIEKIVKIGGLRVQSFSDFETPHLIDMMQAVLDMSGKKLTSQAYTKVPNFAWVFGDTGIKINLSLLAEGNGLNEDGTLRFSSKEGMDIDEAMRLRERYSENVGTILVGVSEEHIRAAMADPRIDYIIPFHKSGWGQNELNLLPVLNSYDNFEDYQNERTIEGYRKNGKPKYGKPKGGNFYPIDYWDYDKSGDENAAIYLRMCEKDGRVPKFEQFLEKDSEGHWVAPSGYWKMLIDFKMYDNDGNKAPQKPVQPNFNMEEAVRVLNEYGGGADSLPVAYDIVDRFVAEKKSAAAPGTRFSLLPSNDILDQRIAQHRNSQLTPAPNGMIPGGNEQEQQPHGDGERQFVVKTIPNNPNIPEWAVEGLLNNPKARYYQKDTNRDQLVRGWQRVQENGVQSEVERLLSLGTFTADDTAESNLLMAMALREDTADPATFFALAEKSAVAGTDTAQALQVRTMISKMTPDGMKIWAAGQLEKGLREHMRTHQPQRQQVDEAAAQVADKIRDLQSGDEVLRLNAGGDFTIDESNNRWGIPINEQQQALIDHYKLNKVARPGIFYNRATMRQRMLEAIIATPNPLEVTGLGLNLVQRLEFMQRNEAVITNADLNYMGTQLGQFVALGGEGGGRAADLALARAYEAFGNITPATRMEKFRTTRYVNMLNTFTSFSRNIIGNMGQNAVNAAAHGIGVEIDRLASLGTGRRTMAHLSTAERIEGWKAFAEETKNTFLDFFVDKVNTAPNRDKYNTNQRGRTFQNSGFEIAKDIESFLMSVGDRNVWKKAFVNSMAEQQKLADRNQLFNADGTTRTQEQMVEQAEADANYATFTEESLAQDVMNYLRSRNPVAADVISLYIPFTGVPHNIMKRNFQYSPFGFLTMAGRMAANAVHGRQFDQHAFVNDLSRALTGTGGVLAGVMLGLGGIIKMGTEDEEKDKVYDVETALGEQYTPYVYDPTTDTYVSMSTFAPSASPLVWGASIGQMLQNDDFNASALIGAMTSSVDSIFDASYLSGLSDLFGGYGSFAENLAHVTAENLSSQLTPAFLNQVANAMDPYVRETKDKDYMVELLKTTMNRIPGLRNMLPEKVTVAGENVTTKQGWSLVDPFTRTNPSDNAALLEVKRLYDVTGRTGVLPSDALRGRKNEIKIDKKSVVLNDQQKEEYKKYYGQLWTSAINDLTSNPAYPLMDDDERADHAEDIMNEAQKRAKKEFIKRYGD